MTAKELRIIFEHDLENLQENCKHEKSQWMTSSFAPGHMGLPVRVCDCCEKVLEEITEKIKVNLWK